MGDILPNMLQKKQCLHLHAVGSLLQLMGIMSKFIMTV
jgi:hypothetical protein